MKKNLYGYNIFTLQEALEELGYKGGTYHTGFPSEVNEWEKDGFHVILKDSPGGRVTLHIHRDPSFHIGATRYKGEDLENEVKMIIKTCKAIGWSKFRLGGMDTKKH